VQQQFATNSGEQYLPGVISFNAKTALTDTTAGASCVRDAATGDIILKIANAGAASLSGTADLSKLGKLPGPASLTVISGDPKAMDTEVHPDAILPETSLVNLQKQWKFTVPAYSLSVIRIKAGDTGKGK
jgi:alpha-L-arabinofuranosidase